MTVVRANDFVTLFVTGSVMHCHDKNARLSIHLRYLSSNCSFKHRYFVIRSARAFAISLKQLSLYSVFRLMEWNLRHRYFISKINANVICKLKIESRLYHVEPITIAWPNNFRISFPFSVWFLDDRQFRQFSSKFICYNCVNNFLSLTQREFLKDLLALINTIVSFQCDDS